MPRNQERPQRTHGDRPIPGDPWASGRGVRDDDDDRWSHRRIERGRLASGPDDDRGSRRDDDRERARGPRREHGREIEDDNRFSTDRDDLAGRAWPGMDSGYEIDDPGRFRPDDDAETDVDDDRRRGRYRTSAPMGRPPRMAPRSGDRWRERRGPPPDRGAPTRGFARGREAFDRPIDERSRDERARDDDDRRYLRDERGLGPMRAMRRDRDHFGPYTGDERFGGWPSHRRGDWASATRRDADDERPPMREARDEREARERGFAWPGDRGPGRRAPSYEDRRTAPREDRSPPRYAERDRGPRGYAPRHPYEVSARPQDRDDRGWFTAQEDRAHNRYAARDRDGRDDGGPLRARDEEDRRRFEDDEERRRRARRRYT